MAGIFRIEDFSGVENRRIAMICESRCEAEMFCSYLDSVGKRWNTDNRYTEWTNYPREDGTVIAYFFNMGTYSTSSSRDGALKSGRYLRFKDFEWSGYNDTDVVETGEWDDIASMIGG